MTLPDPDPHLRCEFRVGGVPGLVQAASDEAKEARVERDLTAADIARAMVDQGLVDSEEE
ncbi:MAG: hypothetical protein OXU72_07470 [Gammaproteobacteria bacterium]|nr:hypothetical protein [Gammaproteobacteria bacterium]